MARSGETIDEFYKRMLPSVLAKLRRLPSTSYVKLADLERLPSGDYKRRTLDTHSGTLLDQFTCISLELLLEYLASPKRRGPSPLTASATIKEWERGKAEFEKELKVQDAKIGKRRGARKAAIEAIAKRWNVTPASAEKRIAGNRQKRGAKAWAAQFKDGN